MLSAAAQLPVDIFYYKIQTWLQEFYRRDMIDRYEAARACSAQTQRMKYLTDDICANPPVYIMNILTYSHTNLQMPFTLPNCDPNMVNTLHRIPQSHITSFYRRALSLRLPRFLLTDN
jgi:hypothetical protein